MRPPSFALGSRTIGDGQPCFVLAEVASAHGVRFAADPCHFWSNPVYYPIEDAKAAWRQATASVLWLTARDSTIVKVFEADREDYLARIACFRDVRQVALDDAGHNMQHDQPEQVARLIEEFFA